jgi:hypothetical protein
MIGRPIITLAILLLVASPCAASGITPEDGWLWKVDVAVDNFRVWINPSLEPVIEAERIGEAHQMVATGDIVAAQQAMNHVRSTAKNGVEIAPILNELEESEIGAWNDLVLQYGVSDVNAKFPIPQRLERIPDGEYVFTITTTSGEELGTYTAMKTGDMAYVRSGDACGSFGKVRLHWTYTMQEMKEFAEQYEGIR